MSPIIVTGATGFIGRAFFGKYERGNYRLMPVVRSLSKAHDIGLRNPILFQDLERIEIDERNGGSVVTLLHLAGGSRDEGANSLWSAIVCTTQAAIQRIRRLGLKRIIYMSGYGVNEDSSESFIVAKWNAEEVIRSCGVPYTILRCSYVLGHNDELTPTILQAIKAGEVSVPGDGLYRIQPLYVEDVVDILWNAAQEVSNENYVVDLLGEPITYVNFVKGLIERTSARARIIHRPVEEFLRASFSSGDADFTASELGVLLLDLVGPRTESCFGVRIRGVDEILNLVTKGESL